MKTPKCHYCGEPAKKKTGADIYPHRPDLHHKHFWACDPCGAYVGCHNGTWDPLGSLADAELRALRMRAHEAFDVVWKDGTLSRKLAYKWLGALLEKKHLHIGSSGRHTCQKIIELCDGERWRETLFNRPPESLGLKTRSSKNSNKLKLAGEA